MLHSLVQTLHTLPPWEVLGVLCLIAFIENVFPPSPSDLVVVAGGTLVGIGTVAFAPALAAATLGSVMGFLVAFGVGRLFGRRIVEARRLPWVSVDAVHKVEKWFRRYGYALIVANRFLSGTRAVISFVAGMAEMRLGLTTLLCAVSALAWNCLLIVAGMELGANWEQIAVYLESYSKVVTFVLVLAALAILVHTVARRQRTGREG